MSALSDTQNSIVPAGNEVIHDVPEGAAVSLEDVSVAAVVQRVAEIDRDYASLLVPSKQSISFKVVARATQWTSELATV